MDDTITKGKLLRIESVYQEDGVTRIITSVWRVWSTPFNYEVTYQTTETDADKNGTGIYGDHKALFQADHPEE